MKNNRAFEPSPKPTRKERKRKGRRGSRSRSRMGRGTNDAPPLAVPEDIAEEAEEEENELRGFGLGMQVDEIGGSSASGTATEFGMEITNTAAIGTTASGSSPRKISKRLFTDVEGAENRDRDDGRANGLKDVRTPKKKAKLTTDLSESDGMNSEDEVEVEIWKEQQAEPAAPL